MSVAILARLTRPACLDPVLAIVGPDADQSTYQQVYHQLGF